MHDIYCVGNVIFFFHVAILHCCRRTHRLRWWIFFSTLQKTYINGIPLFKSTGKKYVIKSPIWDSLESTIFLRTRFSKKIFLQFGSYISYIYIYHFQFRGKKKHTTCETTPYLGVKKNTLHVKPPPRWWFSLEFLIPKNVTSYWWKKL